MEKRIGPWINKKIVEYIGEEEPTLTEFICNKVSGLVSCIHNNECCLSSPGSWQLTFLHPISWRSWLWYVLYSCTRETSIASIQPFSHVLSLLCPLFLFLPPSLRLPLQVLDEEAEVFVVKLWRLLIYETEAKHLGIAKNY